MVKKLLILSIIFSLLTLLSCKTCPEAVIEDHRVILPVKPIFTPTMVQMSPEATLLLTQYYAGEAVDKDRVIQVYSDLVKDTAGVVAMYDGYSRELEIYITDIIAILEKQGIAVWIPPEEIPITD